MVKKVLEGTCFRCGRKDVGAYISYLRHYICKECLLRFVELKVKRTIEKYKMLPRGSRLCIAVSGGKDSVSLLNILHKIMPNIEIIALHINLGIPSYSDECERVSRNIASMLDIPFYVYDIKAEGFSISDFYRTPFRKRMCAVCGTVKRYLLNKKAYELGADVLATGHNLDDIVEILFELYMRGSVEEIVRIKPVIRSENKKLVTKIKPLCEITEEETKLYATFAGLPLQASTCPLIYGSRMLRRKAIIEMISKDIPAYKHTFFKSHVKRWLPLLEKHVVAPDLKECSLCSMPSKSEVCSYCKIKNKLFGMVKESV